MMRLADPNPSGGHVASVAPARTTVFGLDVHADSALRLLSETSAAPTGRRLELSVSDRDPGLDRWFADGELVCDQREVDGSVSFRIEFDPEVGYLIGGPAYGRHVLDADGRRARCFPEGRADHVWQRLLIAQVLPFAALLQGLEVLHASAVASEAGAIVLSGPSGAGKTSLALELCRRGGRFLTDDVLALECADGEELLGHPGAPVAGLPHAEARRLDSLGAPATCAVLGTNARERLLRVRGAERPTPVAALFFLGRQTGASSAPRFEAMADPRMLLASTFNTVLRTPARLRSLLELCALVAARRVERVLIGPGTQVEQLAEAIERRAGVAP